LNVTTAAAVNVARNYRLRTGTVLLRDPGGQAWGWFVDGPARMHIRPMDADGRLEAGVIFLEEEGRRCFIPVGVPARTAEQLQAVVEQHRPAIERAWVKFMILKGWINVYVDRDYVIVIAYPGVVGVEFVRVLHLADIIGRSQPRDVALDAGTGDIIVDDAHVQLGPVLWL